MKFKHQKQQRQKSCFTHEINKAGMLIMSVVICLRLFAHFARSSSFAFLILLVLLHVYQYTIHQINHRLVTIKYCCYEFFMSKKLAGTNVSFS